MDTICRVRVQQKTVRFILKTMDPDGERLRSIHKQRRRGPNFLVHMGSYYTFLPYGFLIHSAKDRLSREILCSSDFLHQKIPSMWQDCITNTST